MVELSGQTRRADWQGLCAVLLLSAATLLVFGPVCGHEFSWWDDPMTIHHNPRFNPVSADKIRQTWAGPVDGLYAPVTYTYWGALAHLAEMDHADETGIHLDARVYHTGSLVLHLAAALVVFSILRTLSQNVVASAAGALLFAIHPVQVESVAWASGGKDLLSGLLSLCAIYLYVLYAQYATGPSHNAHGTRSVGSPSKAAPRVYYAAGGIILLLAMLAKPAAMVVPAIVAAIDLLIIRRPWRTVARAAAGWAALVLPLMIVARVVQESDGIPALALWRRPFIAADAIAFYLGKLFWPANMGPDYGRRPAVVAQIWGGAWAYLIWIVPATIATWAWRGRARRPWALAGVLLFVAGVAPVLGFTPFMFQYMSTVADHYLYLALLGPAVVATWLLVRYQHRLARAAAALAILALAARSHVQLAVWHDDPTLWAHALIACPDSFVAPTNMAAALGREASVLGMRAVDLRDQGDLARAAELDVRRRQNYQESVALLERALAMNPSYVTARHNAFVNCMRLGWHRRAAEHLETILAGNERGPAELRKHYDPFYETAGDLWAKAGDYAKAAAHFETAIARGVGSADIATKLATARNHLDQARIE